MKKDSIFPVEIAQFTVENHFTEYSRGTQVIYLSLIFSFLLILISLPFVKIKVSVQSSGILRPAIKTASLKSTANGKVLQQLVTENQNVKKGQLLFVIGAPAQEERKIFLHTRIEEVTSFTHDLKVLIANPTQKENFLKTSFYAQSLQNFNQKLIESRTKYLKSKTDYERNSKLYEEKVIAAVDYENFKFEFDKAKNDLETIAENQQSTWQNELRVFEKELNDLKSQMTQLEKEQESYSIIAPVSGTIQNMSGTHLGSNVFVNQELAQLSPDTTLLAEIYVSPSDIGMIQENMQVKIKIDAYDYNQWGFVTGFVKEISEDIYVRQDKHFFEVKCVLDNSKLSLRNGYQGKLKKGMSLNANFIVTERTLWQLLYDKADNWLNPSHINKVLK